MQSLRFYTPGTQCCTRHMRRPGLQAGGHRSSLLSCCLPISRSRCSAASKDGTVTTKQTSKPSGTGSQAPITPAEYMAPFSTVDPRMHISSANAAGAGESSAASSNSSKAGTATSSSNTSSDSSSSSSSSGTSTELQPDKWGETLAVNHTLSSLYLRKVEVEPFQQLDLAERRRKRELAEMTAAAAKQGTSAEVIESNMAKLQQLVPGLHPNLDQMKASDWASILKDVDKAVALVITLKTFYPKVDIGRLLQRTPKLLMKPLEQVQADAQQVKALLSKVEDIDAIIDAVPYLMNPKELQQSLANLTIWFPNQDPYEVLQQNPTMLVNIEEADLEADPLYGMPTIDPSSEWPLQ